ncbi:MAG: protein kinase [Rubrobacter sp.]|nr:protein kinase [Rubrobacter sp.]
MATVYLGTDEVLDRPVAVKVLKSGFGETDIGERFRREGRTAARLSHPNVVQVYDAGEGELEDRTASYIVMEYVPGGDLKQLIDQRGYLPAAELARLGAEAASGLGHAHEKGVIHRDIKPHNILLDGYGRCKLTDFGIARALDSAGVTRSGDYLGTALYSAPEQLRGEEVTPKSDVYSLGATLYQAAAGEPPFSGSPLEVANQHVNKPPALPEHLAADAPGRGLGRLILDCLAKDPGDRPDASAVRERLSELAARGADRTGTTQAAAGAAAAAGARRSPAAGGPAWSTAGRKAGRTRRRHRPFRVVMAALAVAILFAGGVFALLESDEAPQGGGQPPEPAGAPAAEPEPPEAAQPTPESAPEAPPEQEPQGQEPPENEAPAAGVEEPEVPEDADPSPGQPDPGESEEPAQEPDPAPVTPPEDSSDGGEGSGSPSGEELSEGDAERTVEEVYRAAAAGDYESSYGLLSSRFQSEVAGSPENWAATFDTLERISFVQGPQATVSGGTAEVTGETRAVHTDRTELNAGSWILVQEDGQWKLDGVNVQTRQV